MFHVKPGDWWHHYWRLRRQLNGYTVAPTPLQCRKAALLLQLAQRGVLSRPQGSAADAEAASDYLDDVIDYGRKAFNAELAWRTSQARVGAQRLDPDAGHGRHG